MKTTKVVAGAVPKERIMKASRLTLAGGVAVVCGTLYVIATSLLPPSVTPGAESSHNALSGDGHMRELAAVRKDLVSLKAALEARRHEESGVGTRHSALSHLQQTVGTMHSELSHLQDDVRALQQQVKDRTNGASDQQADVIDRAPKDPQARDQTRQQRRRERLHVLETRFQREPRVTPWSTATAAAITQVLAREELQQTHVVDMACRATLCRLEVTHPDLQAVDDFAHLFPMELAGVLPQMHYDHEQLHDGSIRMVIYMGHERSAPAEAQ
jgi:hypothetical protein